LGKGEGSGGRGRSVKRQTEIGTSTKNNCTSMGRATKSRVAQHVIIIIKARWGELNKHPNGGIAPRFYSGIHENTKAMRRSYIKPSITVGQLGSPS